MERFVEIEYHIIAFVDFVFDLWTNELGDGIVIVSRESDDCAIEPDSGEMEQNAIAMRDQIGRCAI